MFLEENSGLCLGSNLIYISLLTSLPVALGFSKRKIHIGMFSLLAWPLPI